jgi:hypothetical protein
MCIGPVGLAETYSTLTRRPPPDVAPAIGLALGRDDRQFLAPPSLVQPQVEEPRPGDLHARHTGKRLQPRLEQRRQRAGIGTRRLGQHHRRIGREVAMCRVARRLHRHALAGKSRRQLARLRHGVEHIIEVRGELGVEAQGGQVLQGIAGENEGRL